MIYDTVATVLCDPEESRASALVYLHGEHGRGAGHAPEKLKVGVHAMGYVAETTQQAIDDFSRVTPKPLRASERNAAGPQQSPVPNSRPCGASMARCWWATPKKWRKKFCATVKHCGGYGLAASGELGA